MQPSMCVSLCVYLYKSVKCDLFEFVNIRMNEQCYLTNRICVTNLILSSNEWIEVYWASVWGFSVDMLVFSVRTACCWIVCCEPLLKKMQELSDKCLLWNGYKKSVKHMPDLYQLKYSVMISLFFNILNF